jgi:hypothetical protein
VSRKNEPMPRQIKYVHRNTLTWIMRTNLVAKPPFDKAESNGFGGCMQPYRKEDVRNSSGESELSQEAALA